MLEIHIANNLPEQIKKVAGFDIDGTIIETSSGAKFAKDSNDWKFLYDNTIAKLNELEKDGYFIVFFTNQNGIGNGKQNEQEWIDKMHHIIAKLNLNNIAIYVATENDMYRKPAIGMWNAFINKYKVKKSSKSFYCGDAAGRKKDFSDSDRKFALNLNLKFKTPEELFLGQGPIDKYELSDINPAELVKYNNVFDYNSINLDKNINYLIITVGYPGSGKSYCSHLLNKLYDVHIVNQDTCKTVAACVKLCKTAINNKQSVIIDNTNPTKTVRQKYISLANNMQVICLNFTTDMAIAQHNSKYRNFATNNAVARIPDLVYYIFRKKYEEPSLDEGFNKIINVPFSINEPMPPEYYMYY